MTVAGLALLPMATGHTSAASSSEQSEQQLHDGRKATSHRARTTSRFSKRITSGNHSTTRRNRKTTSQERPSQTVPGARRQLHPTPERYAEIQAALAKAGYYQGAADGVWGASSASALAKFQQDSGLEPTGKIDALSLIKLNLGPKYDNNKATASTGCTPAPVPNDKEGSRE